MTSEIPFPPGSRVVAYLRDSGGDDQDLSVAQQSDVLTAWCQENNLVLSAIYADIAQPGSSTIGRDQFLQMIGHFHDPDCQDAGIILWKFSRFSRDMDDSQYYRADLRRRGYVVHSIHDNIPDTSDGRIYEALIDWRNNKFLEDLSLDVKRGLHHLVSQYHAIPGTPPRGFKREVFIIGNHRDGSEHKAARWVPDPDAWDLCHEAWMLRAQGMPIRQIHQRLHLFGAISSYIWFYRNRIYLGEMKYGQILIKDYAQPMITQEVWDMVQALNQKNAEIYNPAKGVENPHHPRRANSNYLLSGLLYCVRCGSLMNGSTVSLGNGKKLEYYQCGRAHRNMDCDARRIPKTLLEDLIIEKLREYVLDPRVILERDKELALAHEGKSEEVKREIARISEKINSNQRRMENLANRIAEEDDPPKSLISLLHQIETDDQRLHAERERLKSIENNEVVFVRSPKELEKLSKNITQDLTGGDLDHKRKAIRTCISRIAAERDGDYIRGIVYFWNPDETEDINVPDVVSHRGAQIRRHITYQFEFYASIK